MPKPPSAREFLSNFLQAFAECTPDTDDGRKSAWENWTAFMTEKQSKNGGYWPPHGSAGKCVLRVTAEKLGLELQHEYLHLDLVLFPKGEPWGNFVAIEHENAIGSFGEEIEKLMCVLAPLKVGITLGEAKSASNLEHKIQQYFRTRHTSILEPPGTEYLFLLAARKEGPVRSWKQLSFKCSDGPRGAEFQETESEFKFETSTAHGSI